VQHSRVREKKEQADVQVLMQKPQLIWDDYSMPLANPNQKQIQKHKKRNKTQKNIKEQNITKTHKRRTPNKYSLLIIITPLNKERFLAALQPVP
jgi:hypothetical protein